MSLILAQSSPTATVLFYIFALLSAGSAIGVVASRNIVRMAVYLLFTLGGVAGLYFMLHAEFLAAVQLVVYAGGTLILIIFGVMLTSKSPFSRLQPSVDEVAAAVSVGAVLLFALIIGIYTSVTAPAVAADTTQTSSINGAFADRELTTGEDYPVARLGQVLLGDFLIPFEVVSVLLLVVMIGAAYLAKARRRDAEQSL